MTENNEAKQETGINRQFFQEVIEANLPKERIKEKLGDFKNFKNDTVGEVLQAGEKEKLIAYEEKKVKDLPKDWDIKLARLKELEKKVAENEPKIEELKGWTDAFGEKKPLQIQDQIKDLETEFSEFKQKSAAEKQELENKYNLADSELKKWQGEFNQQNPEQIKQKLTDLENKVQEWTQIFGEQEPEEFKQELAELRQRPDITITENEFWDDFAQRKTLPQSKLDREALQKEQEKVINLREKNHQLFFAINDYLKAIRTKRNALRKPVLTIKQAREFIVDLLIETEKSWENYLINDDKESVEEKNLELGLSFWQKEKETRAWQILGWIKEARTTLDYEKLFERWNGGKEYNEENDFDGALYLLGECLKVKDFEVPLTIEEKDKETL